MEKLKQKLYDIIKTKDSHKLQEFILKLETKSLYEIISTILQKRDGFLHINSILRSLDCTTEKSTSTKIRVYKCILKFLKRDEILTEKESGQVVSLLLVNAENLPTDALQSLIKIYINSLAEDKEIVGGWSELLGKLLLLTAKRSDISIDGEALSAKLYQRNILNSLCEYEWSTKTAITLLSVYKDLKLYEEDVDEILYKITKVLKTVDYQSVPPILYNLILLSLAELPERVLQIIIEYFNTQNLNFEREENTDDDISTVSHSNMNCNGSREELNEAAATVILHITHLTQYNAALVKDYMKFVKNSTWLSHKLITPFNLSLALSLSSIDRYKDQILDALKSCILKHYKVKKQANISAWIQKTCYEDYDLQEVFINMANKCQSGWDQVNQGMVNLCFSLLECGGIIQGRLYANQQAISIAISVLPVVMKKESHLTPFVMRQLSSFMFTSSSSHHYLDMVRKLVQMIPHVLLEHIDLVREILEQMILLPMTVAVELLHIFLPLFKMSMTLKDSLVLILRKMLFTREINMRQVSVEGFILCLCHFRIMGNIPSSQGSMSFCSALSQVSADVHTSFNSNTNEALCLEFLGILRRCFTQQAEVKTVLYRGFYEVTKNNPKLGPNVLTILHQHLLPHVDTRQEVLNPILFGKITTTRGDNSVLIEPFGELLYAVCDCTLRYSSFIAQTDSNMNDDDDVTDQLASIRVTLETLAEKLAHVDMDDMDFGSASFSPATDKGKLNLIRAQATVGAYDALMNYVFNSGALVQEDKAKLFVSLFKTQKNLIDLVHKTPKKGEPKDGKAKSSGSGARQNLQSILRLETSVKILKVCLDDDCDANSHCVEVIQQSCDLQVYLISVIEAAVKNLNSYPAQKRKKLLPHLTGAAKLLLRESNKCLINVDVEDCREHSRVFRVLECFSSVIVALFKHFEGKLSEVVRELADGDSDEVNRNLYLLAKQMQTMSRVSFGLNASKMTKESCILINLLSVLTKHMDQSEELVEVHTWLLQICRDETSNSAEFCEAIVSLVYRVYDQIKVNHQLPRIIAKDIYTLLGDNEEHSQTEGNVTHQIITDDTSTAVLCSTLGYVEDSLTQIELAFNVMKCSLQLKTGSQRRSAAEKNVANRLGVLMQTLNEIIKSAIPKISTIDQIFKTTTKLCSVMSTFAKYNMDIFRLNCGNELSEKFERLVYSYGGFKEEVFKMINYHQGTNAKTNSTVALTSRAIKESKIIPNLIFSMETFEKLLMQLARRSKVRLMMNVKPSTSRDFRISLPTVAKALQEMELQQDADDGSGNESEDTIVNSRESSPAPKRLKQSGSMHY